MSDIKKSNGEDVVNEKKSDKKEKILSVLKRGKVAMLTDKTKVRHL